MPMDDPRESVHKPRPTMGRVPNVTRADAQSALRNPLAFIAARWTPDPRTVRRAALAALVMSVVIVVTGGAVRLTGSGLGCPTWPKCTDDSRSEEHTSELQSRENLVCRLLLEKKKKKEQRKHSVRIKRNSM